MQLFRYSLFLFLLMSQIVFAQKNKKIKWGKVTIEDIKMETYTPDPDAHAVVLADLGVVEFGSMGNLALFFKRHTRIKILTKAGVEKANITLGYYRKDDLQEIARVKGHTFNLDENGEIVKTDLEKSMVIYNDVDSEWGEVVFSLPDVQVGSVIEFSYELGSQNFTFLKNWKFQRNIPTLYSEFTAHVPRGLDFSLIYQGNRINEKYKNSPDLYQWSLDTIPAIKDEPFVYQVDDYVEQLNFQLKNYIATWQELAEKFQANNELFNIPKFKTSLVKDEAETLTAGITSDVEKLQVIYDHVATHFKWNGEHLMYREQSLKKVVTNQKGNSAEATAYLILLLRAAKIDVEPVLISTKSHGRIFKRIPFLTNFNHLIAAAKIDGQDYLLDPTDPLRTYHLLALEDLNGEGFLVSDSPRWVRLTSNKADKKVINIVINLEDVSTPKYQVSHSYQQYDAVDERRDYLQAEDKKSYFADLIHPSIEDYTIDSLSTKNIKELTKPFKTFCELSIPHPELSDQADFVYFQPYIARMFVENPFKANHRQFPIDFAAPFERTMRCFITLPKGYKVEDMPENVQVKLGDDIGEFTYLVQKTDANLSISSKVKIKKPLISAKFYTDLKEFYDIIIAKYSEIITFKKNQ